MAVTQVQDRNATNAGAATSHALAFSSNVTAASTLLAFIRLPSNTATVTSITDSLGSTWSLVRRQAHGTAADSGELWKTENIASGGANTVTVNYDASVATQFWIAEFSGSAAVVEDQKTGANNNASTTNGGGTINTVKSESVVVFAIAFATGFSISADPGSYNRQDDGLSNRIAVYTRITSVTLSSEAPAATTAVGEDSCGIVANFGYTPAASGNPWYYYQQQQ